MRSYPEARPDVNPQTLEVLRRLRDECPEARGVARVVGAWVWCEFPDKPAEAVRTAIKAIGFRWNKRRTRESGLSTWQHSCGVRSKRSPGDPKAKYGAIKATAIRLDDDRKAVPA
jgi:hypothetical protein